MPNHITNILRITVYKHEGKSSELVDQILDAMKGNRDSEEDSPFDFNRIIPRPTDLDITQGSVSGNAIALLDDQEARRMLNWPWVRQAKCKTIDALRAHLRKQYLANPEKGFPTLDDFAGRLTSNVSKYGAPTWYEWSCTNWGTKWNAYSVTASKTGEGEAVVHFETAWAPPMPVLDALAAKFPDAHFRLIWTDEGDDVAHRVYWTDGKRESDDKDDAS